MRAKTDGRGLKCPWTLLLSLLPVLLLAACGSEAADFDAGVDAGLEDAGLEDAGLEDAGLEDAGLEDAGLEDAGLEDAGLEDAGLEDAGLEDAGLADAGLPACEPSLPRSAAFLAQQIPASLAPGAQIQVTVSMRNTGTTAWTQAAGTKLGAQAPQDNGRWGTGRVELAPGESVAPCEVKDFTFQITAPVTPGLYAFQWRMLQEGVAWFGAYSPLQIIAVANPQIQVCEAARAYADTDTDASAVIQACLDAAPAGAAVELPAGRYRVDHGVLIRSNPVILRTENKAFGDAPCATGAHDCAELRASTSFGETLGILQVLVNGSIVDHLVVCGDKAARRTTGSGAECAAGHNAYGYNMRLACDDCALSNSVTRDALCGTGCEVSGARRGVTVWRSFVVANGVHDAQGLWADGLTVHDASDSFFAENRFEDNTDVDLIFGGCVRCSIQNNVIAHSADFAGGAFAALMLHAWSTTSGDYAGSLTLGNAIDCGPNRRCGIGLYIGSDAWYDTDTFGGTVRDNTVSRAEFGLLIDDAHDMAVHDNAVSDSGQSTRASCGTKTTYDYGLGVDSFNIDTAGDPTPYQGVDFDGCIPNWWNP